MLLTVISLASLVWPSEFMVLHAFALSHVSRTLLTGWQIQLHVHDSRAVLHSRARLMWAHVFPQWQPRLGQPSRACTSILGAHIMGLQSQGSSFPEPACWTHGVDDTGMSLHCVQCLHKWTFMANSRARTDTGKARAW